VVVSVVGSAQQNRKMKGEARCGSGEIQKAFIERESMESAGLEPGRRRERLSRPSNATKVGGIQIRIEKQNPEERTSWDKSLFVLPIGGWGLRWQAYYAQPVDRSWRLRWEQQNPVGEMTDSRRVQEEAKARRKQLRWTGPPSAPPDRE